MLKYYQSPFFACSRHVLRCTPVFPNFRAPKIPKIWGSQNSDSYIYLAKWIGLYSGYGKKVWVQMGIWQNG